MAISTKLHYFNALTGGAAGSLDAKDGTALTDGWLAIGFVNGVFHVYALDDDSGAAESSPDVIAPDTNAGNKRWILQYVLFGGYGMFYVDAGAMVPCTTNPAESGTVEFGTNDIDFDYYAFDAGATKERVQFKRVMPPEWDLGTIKAKFHWSSDTGSSTGDTVEWAMKAGSLANSDAIDTALGTQQVISDALLADNGGDLQFSGATPAITMAGTPALGNLNLFEILRNTDGTDDMTEDAWLFGAWIQFKMNQGVVAW